MSEFYLLGLAAMLSACAADDAPMQPRSVEDLRGCVRDEINEGRGTAHPSVLGELSVAHCSDEIFRFARAEQGGAAFDRERVLSRTRALESELRQYALRYALGVEG
jgi:hypothetical protein